MKVSTDSSRARFILCAAAVVLVLASISTQAHATRYQVPNYAPDVWWDDGVCSLREAFRASNLRRQVDSCPPGEGANEITIIGDPAHQLELTIIDVIEVTSNMTLRAEEGPGFRQVISGNDTRFIVRKGGELSVSGLNFTHFEGTPFEVQSGHITGRGFVRGVLNFVNSEISGNTFPGGTFQTMGIMIGGGRVYLAGSSIHDNTSIKGGGIINQGGQLVIYNSAIHNNTVSQYGGAIHNIGSGATAYLYDVTLSGNVADLEGGGIYNGAGAVADVVWTTITGNRSAVGAGVNVKTGGTVRVELSIVAGNTTKGGALKDCQGTLTSKGYSLLQSCPGTPSATGDIRNVSASLSPLTFPVHPQSWRLPPWHTPLSNSPAINVIPEGTHDCLSWSGTVDQIYKPRFVGGACDMGAIERQ